VGDCIHLTSFYTLWKLLGTQNTTSIGWLFLIDTSVTSANTGVEYQLYEVWDHFVLQNYNLWVILLNLVHTGNLQFLLFSYFFTIYLLKNMGFCPKLVKYE